MLGYWLDFWRHEYADLSSLRSLTQTPYSHRRGIREAILGYCHQGALGPYRDEARQRQQGCRCVKHHVHRRTIPTFPQGSLEVPQNGSQ